MSKLKLEETQNLSDMTIPKQAGQEEQAQAGAGAEAIEPAIISEQEGQAEIEPEEGAGPRQERAIKNSCADGRSACNINLTSENLAEDAKQASEADQASELKQPKESENTKSAYAADGTTFNITRPAKTDTARKPRKEKKEKEKEKKEKEKEKNAHQKKAKKARRNTVFDDFTSLLLRIAIIVAVVWAVFTFIFGVFVNSGVSMEPSIQDRDIIVFYRMDQNYNTNEAVVYEGGDQERVGRIIAKGGDTVEITSDGLKVNGYLQQDYKNIGETLAVVGGQEYPLQLAQDEYFILGDNREESTDSRMFGPIKAAEIKGSVMIVLRRRDV